MKTTSGTRGDRRYLSSETKPFTAADGFAACRDHRLLANEQRRAKVNLNDRWRTGPPQRKR